MKIFTQQGRALLLSAVLVVIGAVGVSYGDNPEELVGHWVGVDDGSELELFKDGTGVAAGKSVTWKAENKRLRILSHEFGVAADYNVSGYELILVYNGQSSEKFIKKENLEEYKKKKAEGERKEAERRMKEEEQRLEKLSSYFTDLRNGKKYRTVEIDGKTWMAENLNYQTGSSWCYGDNESNCKQYGRLYDWNTAKTACPTGWHLPKREEWENLSVAAGDTGRYGRVTMNWNLRSTFGWAGGMNGLDTYGFSALPAGSRFRNVDFRNVGYVGSWWTASEGKRDAAYSWSLSFDGGGGGNPESQRIDAFSVRCVKDGEVLQLTEPQKKEAAQKQQKELQRIEKLSYYVTDPRDGQKYRTVKMTWRGSQGQVIVDTWMAQNLNYQPQNGNSWCYGDDASNCAKCGRLYDMKTAKDVCPKGWKLGFWYSVAKEIGDKAGEALKSQWGWYGDGNGKDTYGFSALPCGGRSSDGKFTGIGAQGLWWDSRWGTGPVVLNYDNDSMKIAKKDPNLGASVRCVQK